MFSTGVTENVTRNLKLETRNLLISEINNLK